MGLFSNTENYIVLKPKHGRNIGKQYVYKESIKRWTLLRHYAKSRKEGFKLYPYLCVTGITPEGKWTYSNYSPYITSEKLPVPELIYDIKNDKVYIFEGQLWELDRYHILDINDPEFNTEH